MSFRPQFKEPRSVTKANLHENPIVWLLERTALPSSWLFWKLGMSANLVTGLSFLLSLLASVSLIAFQYPPGFAALWTASVYLDFIDGQLARLRRKTHQSAFRTDHTLDLVKFILVSLSLGYFWDRTQIWVMVFLGVSAIMLFTTLNQYLDAQPSTARYPRRPLVSRSGTQSWFRAVWVPLMTFHAGSLLLIAVSPFSLLSTELVYGYFLLIGCVLAVRNTLLLLRLPR